MSRKRTKMAPKAAQKVPKESQRTTKMMPKADPEAMSEKGLQKGRQNHPFWHHFGSHFRYFFASSFRSSFLLILDPILVPKLSQNGPIFKQKGAPEGKGRPSILSNPLNENARFSGFRGAKNVQKSSPGANRNSMPKICEFR